MTLVELILLGVALAMDAFAVTISNSFAYHGSSGARQLMGPVAFGLFQGLMPVAGYYLGGLIGNFIETYAGIITLVILGIIGGNMIKEGVEALRSPESDESRDAPDAVRMLTLPVVTMQAIATSIDAFAVGVSLRAQSVEIFGAATIIAVTTLACCLVAMAIGRRFGDKLGDKAQVVGGIVLVCIGIKAMF